MNIKKLERIIAVVGIFLISSVPTQTFGKTSPKIESLLDSLDQVLAQRQTILNKKVAVINDLKRGISDTQTTEALTVKYEQIYQEYLHFNGDSAIAYAKKAVETAEKTGRPEMVLTSKFCLLRAYTRQGLQGKAYETILDIGKIEDLQPVYRAQYADILLDFYMRVNLKQDIDYKPDIDLVEAWKRYSNYLVKGTPEYIFYNCVFTGQVSSSYLEKMLAKLRQPSFQSANMFYAAAMESRREGNNESFYENLIRASINDVLLANTEVSSLLSLLDTPLLQGDLKRSNAYIQICSDNVQQYHDVHRSLSVISIQERINKQLNEERNKQMTVIIIVAILFFIALIISVVEMRMLAQRGKKVKHSLDSLRVMHEKEKELATQQQKLSDKLKKANVLLSDRVSVYRKDFLNVYHLVSSYISYEKTVRKDLSNQLKTNNVRKAIRTLDSNTDVDGQLKHFYVHFDHAFLAMYPDYIERMNSLLKPECRFDETMTELTTSLRIYALVVLGVTDSVSIADFLHLSSQTVYNYRLKMRRMAAGDEKKFDDEVVNQLSTKPKLNNVNAS